MIEFNRLRFLIADQNAQMRRIVRTLLYGFGSRDVIEVDNGAAAFEAFVHFAPDIVITDWNMPIIDGLELTQMIRQPEASANPCVPIIMLSANSERRHIVAARDAGVTEFLVKPMSAKALHDRILSVAAKPRPFVKSKKFFGPDRRRSGRETYVGPERRSEDRAEDATPAGGVDKWVAI